MSKISKYVKKNKPQEKIEYRQDSRVVDLTSLSIKKLIKKGKESKLLTWDEINKAIPEGSLSSDQIEPSEQLSRCQKNVTSSLLFSKSIGARVRVACCVDHKAIVAFEASCNKQCMILSIMWFRSEQTMNFSFHER